MSESDCAQQTCIVVVQSLPMFHPFMAFMAKARSALVVRFFLIIAIAMVVPAGILFAAALALFENVVRESINSELETALDGAERDLTSFLADLTAVSGALVEDTNIAAIFTPDNTDFERVKALDKAVDGFFMALPGRDAVRWTFLAEDGIYSSWSRNFNDYRFLRDTPLALRARELDGHVAWEGFNPSFQTEERNWSSLVSLARQFPVAAAVPGARQNSRPTVLILSAEKEAFRKYLRDRRVSDYFATLLVAKGGEVVVDAANRAIPAAVLEAATEALAKAGNGVKSEQNIGNYLMVSRRLEALPAELVAQDWSVAVLYSYGVLSQRFDRLRTFFIPAFAVLFAAALIVSWFISRWVVRPVAALNAAMDGWRPETVGDEGIGFNLPVSPAMDALSADAARSDEIGSLNRAFSRLQTDIVILLDRLKRESEVREMYRYRSLRAQLNPHFLFNSLASVRWLAIMRKADNIVAAVDDLTGLLGYSMGKGGDFSSLREEVESVEHYLAIQNLRFGGRFRLETSIPPEALDAEALRFMLQPLAENCVVHGYEGASGEGEIEICASISGSTLTVTVSDRGVGVDQVVLDRKTAQETVRETGETLGGAAAATDAQPNLGRDTGLGLRNVRDMLSITYGKAVSLSLLSRDGGGATVRICLPLRKGGAS